jgi:sporulation integral membrane protein YtvI
VARLIVELLHLSTFLPDYISNIKTVVISLQNRAEAYYFTLPPDVLDFINTKIAESAYSLDAILNKTRLITGSLLNFLLQLVASVPAWIILIIISGIATYFIAKDRREITRFWLRIIPSPWGKKLLGISNEIFRAIVSYVRAQLVLISITLIQSVIGLYFIKAPYALLIGLMIGVADLIPVLGPSSIYLPWIAWEFITGDTVFAVKLTILFAIVLIVRQILETKIVSHSMGLHPLATLVAMYVGLQILGPLGVIAGPLFIIVLKAFASAGLIGWPEER